MSLLRDIQAAAADPSVSTADLLRKCQILAYRLGNEAFRVWVSAELDGYGPDVELPAYRSNHRGPLVAQVVNPVRHASNVPVPTSLLPEWYRDRAGAFDFREGVGYLQSLVAEARAAHRSSFQSPIPPEIYADIEIFDGFATVGMSATLGVSVVAGVLDQVRNRALRFALELESLDPEAGERSEPITETAQRQVTNIYNNTIQGAVGALAQGAQDFEQTAVVVSGDVESLKRELSRLGIDATELDQLTSALADDAAGKVTPGPRTNEWIGQTTLRLARSAGRIGESTTAGLVAAAIARYLGVA